EVARVGNRTQGGTARRREVRQAHDDVARERRGARLGGGRVRAGGGVHAGRGGGPARGRGREVDAVGEAGGRGARGALRGHPGRRDRDRAAGRAEGAAQGLVRRREVGAQQAGGRVDQD